MKFREIELNPSKELKNKKGFFVLKRKIYRRSLAMLVSLSLSLPFVSMGEERVYGISDYGPVSVNGNGVGRGNDPSYQYIEDLLYGNKANTPSPNTNSTGNPSGNTFFF